MDAKQVNKINKVLIIQTAFIGDVILATGIIQKLKTLFPESQIDFLLRDGIEKLINNDPGIHNVILWKKKSFKYRSLLGVIRTIRANKYDIVINVQRYFSTGLITFLSGAAIKIGFKQNPFSLFYSHSVQHDFPSKNGIHEIERNHHLIQYLTDEFPEKPKLFFSDNTLNGINKYQAGEYICIAPSSVWFTKQFPVEKWIELCDSIRLDYKIILVGGPDDENVCTRISNETSHPDTLVMAGKLKLDETAALISGAKLIFTNDSAPLHMGSATNVPTCAVFCSTLPSFGFGPLSKVSIIIETKKPIDCRPCGLHGKINCPEGHFNCALDINIKELKELVSKKIQGIFK